MMEIKSRWKRLADRGAARRASFLAKAQATREVWFPPESVENGTSAALATTTTTPATRATTPATTPATMKTTQATTPATKKQTPAPPPAPRKPPQAPAKTTAAGATKKTTPRATKKTTTKGAGK